MIEIEEAAGVSTSQMLHPILAFLMGCKEEKFDLHMRPLGDLYLKVPSGGAAQLGVHFRG